MCPVRRMNCLAKPSPDGSNRDEAITTNAIATLEGASKPAL